MSIRIRDLEQKDSDQFAELLIQLSCEASDALMTEKESITLGKTQHSRTQQLILADNRKVLLAITDKKLVGFIGLTQGLFDRNRHSAALTIGVITQYWGQGIASQLMHQALHWAEERGIMRIEIGVLTTNQRAIRLYKKFGFKKKGVKQATLLVNMSYLDEILMARVKLLPQSERPLTTA